MMDTQGVLQAPRPQPTNAPFSGRKHKIYLVIGIIISLLIIFLSIGLATTRTSWFGRAQTPGAAGVLSRENSYVFASPVSTLADGSSLIRITVFLLTTEGLGVSGAEVGLSSEPSLTVAKTQSQTDSVGRAIFDLSAANPGDYTITAEAQGVILPQKVSVSFR